MKKAIAIILSIMMIMVITIPASAFSNITPAYKAEVAKGPVNVKLVLVGDAGTDQQLVFDEINKMLKTDINTTVDVTNIPWASYTEKYNLMFSSGENFDATYSANWLNYGTIASKNGFKEITTDMLKNYMPLTNPDFDPSFLKGVKVKGKIYMIPSTFNIVQGTTVDIRGDLRVKYNLPKPTTREELFNYMITVAKKQKGILAYNGQGDDDKFRKAFLEDYYGFYDAGAPGVAVKSYATKYTVFNEFTTPEYAAYVKQMKVLADAGAFSKSILASKTTNKDAFVGGTSAIYLNGLEDCVSKQISINKDHPDWKVELCDLDKDRPKSGNGPMDGGWSLNAKAKNPERALMVIDLLRSSKKYFDLFTYGIEGKHYKAVGDNQYEQLPDGEKSYSACGTCPWSGQSAKLQRSDKSTPIALINYIRDYWLTKYQPKPITGFNFDNSKCKSELAAISNIVKTYRTVQCFGQVADVSKSISDFNKKLNAVGIKKVITESQKQVDAFMKEYNK